MCYLHEDLYLWAKQEIYLDVILSEDIFNNSMQKLVNVKRVDEFQFIMFGKVAQWNQFHQKWLPDIMAWKSNYSHGFPWYTISYPCACRISGIYNDTHMQSCGTEIRR